MPSFTRNAIIASFLKLLNERPLHKITVKDIVEDCGINRNSFYYHFEDLPALVEAIVEENADKIMEEHASAASLEECLDIAIDFAMQNKKAILNIYHSVNRETYDQYLNRVCEYVVTGYVERVAGEYAICEEDKAILIKYYKCELIGQILDWMKDGMRYDIVKQFHRICSLFEGSAQIAFRRSAGQEDFLQ